MTIEVRSYGLTVKSRFALAALTVVGVGLGAILLTIGLAVLAALVAGGLVLGGGYALLRRVRGQRDVMLVRQAGMREVFSDEPGAERATLPPGREVFPEEPPR